MRDLAVDNGIIISGCGRFLHNVCTFIPVDSWLWTHCTMTLWSYFRKFRSAVWNCIWAHGDDVSFGLHEKHHIYCGASSESTVISSLQNYCGGHPLELTLQRLHSSIQLHFVWIRQYISWARSRGDRRSMVRISGWRNSWDNKSLIHILVPGNPKLLCGKGCWTELN